MKIGFIGCGNMAQAIIKGILAKGLVSSADIFGSNSSAEHAANVQKTLGIQTFTDNNEVVNHSDIVFLSVKPQQYEAVISEIKDAVLPEQIIVTIAPGKTIQWLEGLFGKPVKLVRTMPNTPALVGEGLTSYCENSLVSKEELASIEELLSSFGKIEHLKEALIDVASAVGGSGPAYVYQFIEALADAGVSDGLPRTQAYEIAAQMVLGSAKMVLETGKHPGQLKDEVCSPGGSTIKGVEVLEDAAFRGAVIRAIRSCTQAARSL